MSLYREFWIEVKSFSSNCLSAWSEEPDNITKKIAKEIIKVVEASALQELKIENAHLKEKLRIAIDALELYAMVFSGPSHAKDALEKIK